MVCDQLRRTWTASLGLILALLMFASNVSHAVDLHIDLDNHHQHCHNSIELAASSESSDSEQQSGQQSHAAIHHCHGASCYFLQTGAIPELAAPAASDFVLGSPALLRFSFGIAGEEIDPPRV
jgi:hypothetical protein